MPHQIFWIGSDGSVLGLKRRMYNFIQSWIGSNEFSFVSDRLEMELQLALEDSRLLSTVSISCRRDQLLAEALKQSRWWCIQIVKILIISCMIIFYFIIFATLYNDKMENGGLLFPSVARERSPVHQLLKSQALVSSILL